MGGPYIKVRSEPVQHMYMPAVPEAGLWLGGQARDMYFRPVVPWAAAASRRTLNLYLSPLSRQECWHLCAV